MSEMAVPESVRIPALPEQVRAARAFVAAVLGQSHPHADVTLLLTSELVTNSVRHSGSAVPGGLVTVTVTACRDGVRVEVTDHSGDGVPVLHPADGGGQAEGSRGMQLVDTMAALGLPAGRGAHHHVVRDTGFIASDSTFGAVR